MAQNNFKTGNEPKGSPRKRLFTLKEAAEYLGRSEWGMRELIWKRAIKVVREPRGRKIFLDLQDLNEYIDRNKSEYR
jgi:excisionase family DNA binding protein